MPVTTLRDGRAIQWSDGGASDGVPVLFFHGSPDTRRAAWSGHDPAREAGLRLVAVNRPGYGASSPAPPSYRRVVDDAVELADLLGLDTFGVLGMSVGGTFALACAALRPDRVRAAAVVAAPGEAPRMDPPWTRDDLDREGRAWYAALAAGTVEENVARVRPDFLAYRATVGPEDPDDAALAERWVTALPDGDRLLVAARPASERAAAAREALLVPDGYLADAALVFHAWDFRVEDVRCPVALWYGARDANAPPRNGAWLADRLSSATLRVLPEHGHLETLLRNWTPILASALGG